MMAEIVVNTVLVVAFALAWYVMGVVSGVYVIPWLVDRNLFPFISPPKRRQRRH